MFEKAKEKYKDTEYKFLIAKMIDKYEFAISKNKITYTDFLNISEISIIKKVLQENKIENYIFYGGIEDADRKLLIFYPEKFSKEMVEKNFSKILKLIRITLPNNLSFEHREYLSGIMKLGIKREKFGDILVRENGADVVVLSDITNVFLNDLKLLTRFQKSQISELDISEIMEKENEFVDVNIIVSSIRLDNFVSELARCSRSQASEIIKEGRVFINSINEFKDSKKINVNDVITIRGKGKYIFDLVQKQTRSERYLLNLRKYK